MAVTDHNGLYGAPRFARAARQAGLPAIVGAEMEVMTDGAPERQSDRATEKGGNEDRADFAPSLYRSISPSFHLTLLVEDSGGYANLCRLLSRGQLAGSKGKPLIAPEDLATNAGGLVCLSGCRKGPLAAALLRGERAAALEWGQRLRDLFRPGRFWVGSSPIRWLPGPPEFAGRRRASRPTP